MIKVRSDADRVLVAKLQECGQSLLFDLWQTSSAEEQKTLLAQLRTIDLTFVKNLIQQYREGGQKKLFDKVRQPSNYLKLEKSPAELLNSKKARLIGEKALSEGKVALLMVAGGLGSRIGDPNPKGTFPIGPVSGKSLYCLHAQKIKALGRRYRASIPFYIITSSQTHEKTVESFKENEYFGLSSQDVKFIIQDSFPVTDRRGRFLLSERGKISMRPNGHGDALMQIIKEENFKNLSLRGIEHIFYFQVDNPLVQIADPHFVGQHILGNYDATCKSVLKTDPTEKIGLFCQCNGVTSVVEYSELSPEDQQQRLPDGNLVFSAGNMAVHMFSVEFLNRIRQENRTLPYHFVEKKTSYLDRRGGIIPPSKPNSIAFETFIFDALAWSQKTLIIETEREEEFSPIKNAEGIDSTASAKEAICRLYNRWLHQIGAEFPDTEGDGNGVNNSSCSVEISPLYALNSEELREKITLPFKVTPNLYLE